MKNCIVNMALTSVQSKKMRCCDLSNFGLSYNELFLVFFFVKTYYMIVLPRFLNKELTEEGHLCYAKSSAYLLCFFVSRSRPHWGSRDLSQVFFFL